MGLGAALSVALAVTATAGTATAAPGDPLFLGDADTFSVLAHTTVTNDGAATLLDRDLGVDAGSSTGLLPGQIQGSTHLGDALSISAQTDATAAANDLMAAPTYVYGAPDLAGHTFVAGSYSSATGLNNTGVITLQGDADDVFIFTAVSDITLGGLSSVAFIGGAQPCNVFWRAGSSASIGVGAAFVGTMIAGASVSVNTDATVNGRLIAQTGQVSLLNNVFTTTPCASGGDGDTDGATGPVAPTTTVPVVTPPGDGDGDGDGEGDGEGEGDGDGAGEGDGDGGNTTLADTGATLAATGVDATEPALIAAFLTLLGFVLVLTARLRSTGAPARAARSSRR